MLQESAQGLVSRLLPEPTMDERLAVLTAVTAKLHAAGVTSVQNALGSAVEFDTYERARRDGTLAPAHLLGGVAGRPLLLRAAAADHERDGRRLGRAARQVHRRRELPARDGEALRGRRDRDSLREAARPLRQPADRRPLQLHRRRAAARGHAARSARLAGDDARRRRRRGAHGPRRGGGRGRGQSATPSAGAAIASITSRRSIRPTRDASRR